MHLTVKLDMSNATALALLNYIKTLDFVSFVENETLSDVQKHEIDIGIKALEEGSSLKHSEVMSETKKRYPNLFR